MYPCPLFNRAPGSDNPAFTGVFTPVHKLYIPGPTMTVSSPAPRPPSRWLFAALAYAMATVALGIGLSIFAVGLASLTLALDFDSIDRAIATGAPKQFSWLLAHGLIVTLVWLYIEFLRLLARLRGD